MRSAAVSLVVACLPAKTVLARSPDSFDAIVMHVHDGDTLWVKTLDGAQRLKLRLEGLDAPEICQDGGLASRDALAGVLAERRVEVHTRRRDSYGRPLARVVVDGEDVGAWLVHQGHAWSYRYRNSEGPYAREESLARAKDRGLFADPTAEEPRHFRRRHGPCRQP